MRTPGAALLDHTGDAGLELEAPDLATLFDRAARAMTELLLDGPAPAGSSQRHVHLGTGPHDVLLRLWLQELVYLHDTEGFRYASAAFATLSEEGVDAMVRGSESDAGAAREIKGVTHHGLRVQRSEGGWRARVIFDL